MHKKGIILVHKTIYPFITCTADWRAHRRFWLEHGHLPYQGRYEREITIKQYNDPFTIVAICVYVETRLARLRMQRAVKPSSPLPLP